jgi:hypothetical protein
VFDLRGDGPTAVKGNVGKYMRAFSTVGFAALYNPMVISTDRRTWTDRNGDDIPQDSEIGPVNTPFNTSGISNRVPDPASAGRTVGVLARRPAAGRARHVGVSRPGPPQPSSSVLD